MKTFKRYYGHDVDHGPNVTPFDSGFPEAEDPTMHDTLDKEKAHTLEYTHIGHTVDLYEVTFKLIETVVVTKKLVKVK